MRIKSKEIGFYVFMLVLSIAFMLIYAYTNSPLMPFNYGADSAFFTGVGNAMTKGYVPYKDFFDMKGPYLFLIQYIGQLLVPGRTGAFIICVISVVLTVCLSDRCLLAYCDRKVTYFQRILACILPAMMLASTMEGGNLTEQFSLPLLFLSLLLTVKYFKSRGIHPLRYAFLHGALFGFIALIRVTNAALIGANVLGIGISLLMQKKYRNFFANIGMFLDGVIAAMTPAIIWFSVLGCLKDMLDCTFVFGFRYATENTFRLIPMIIVIPFGLIAGLLGKPKRDIIIWQLIAAIFTTIVLLMGYGYLHYYMLTIPLVCIGVYNLLRLKGTKTARFENAVKQYAFTGFSCIVVLVIVAYAGMYTRAAAGAMFSKGASYYAAKEVAEYIPEEHRDSVLPWSIEYSFCLINDLVPCSKYIAWQNHYVQLSPQVKEDIKHLFKNNPPEYVVTRANTVIPTDFVQEIIENDYTLVMENTDYTLYRLK